MKYAICNETFGDMALHDALKLAFDSGYRGWEVAPFMLTDDITDYTSDERHAYRDAVESAGLEVIGLHWLLAKTQGFHLTTLDTEVRTRTTEYLKRLVELCRDLGGTVMVLGSPQQRNYPEATQTNEQAMDAAADCLRPISETLEACGVKLALEPLGRSEGNFLNTAAQGRELMNMIGSEHIGLHLDVKAMSDEAAPIETTIRENADVMLHFHANDPNLLGPGMGEVKFEPIFEALRDVDYRGWVSVEVFDYSPGVAELARGSMKNMLSAQT